MSPARAQLKLLFYCISLIHSSFGAILSLESVNCLSLEKWSHFLALVCEIVFDVEPGHFEYVEWTLTSVTLICKIPIAFQFFIYYYFVQASKQLTFVWTANCKFIVPFAHCCCSISSVLKAFGVLICICVGYTQHAQVVSLRLWWFIYRTMESSSVAVSAGGFSLYCICFFWCQKNRNKVKTQGKWKTQVAKLLL